MLYSIFIAADVLIAIGLIALVLLQQGKGADAGAAFGSGASSTVFGAQGSASFLTKATAVLAALFFINSLGLAYLAHEQRADTSVMDSAPSQRQPPAEAPNKTGSEAAGGQQQVPEDVPTGGSGSANHNQPMQSGSQSPPSEQKGRSKQPRDVPTSP